MWNRASLQSVVSPGGSSGGGSAGPVCVCVLSYMSTAVPMCAGNEGTLHILPPLAVNAKDLEECRI